MRKVTPREFVAANDETMPCDQVGDFRGRLYNAQGGRLRDTWIRNVHYVPGLQTNL